MQSKRDVWCERVWRPFTTTVDDIKRYREDLVAQVTTIGDKLNVRWPPRHRPGNSSIYEGAPSVDYVIVILPLDEANPDAGLVGQHLAAKHLAVHF